jgi:hypothetical protein
MPDVAPLTHHEWLALAEPFVRAGFAPDVAASDRGARRIAFRPRAHAADAALPARREHYELHAAEAAGGAHRLVRHLVFEGAHDAPAGPAATALLEATARDPAVMLPAMQAVPHARHHVASPPGAPPFHATLDFALLPAGGLALVRAAAEVGPLALAMKVSRVAGFPAELELSPRPHHTAPAHLPDDLLCVLGAAWDRLTPVRSGWLAQIGLRGEEPRRSAEAEARFVQTLRHLADTFEAPPAAFHRRHAAARWRVAALRTAPLWVGAAVCAAAIYVQRLGPEQESFLRLIVNVAPPLLLGLFFMRREMPRIEWPRAPRRVPESAWVPTALTAAPAAATTD